MSRSIVILFFLALVLGGLHTSYGQQALSPEQRTTDEWKTSSSPKRLTAWTMKYYSAGLYLRTDSVWFVYNDTSRLITPALPARPRLDYPVHHQPTYYSAWHNPMFYHYNAEPIEIPYDTMYQLAVDDTGGLFPMVIGWASYTGNRLDSAMAQSGPSTSRRNIYQYNTAGQLNGILVKHIVDSTGQWAGTHVEEYTRDAQGRLIEEKEGYQDTAGPVQFSHQHLYVYDSLGRLATQTTWVNGYAWRITVSYDLLGRINAFHHNYYNGTWNTWSDNRQEVFSYIGAAVQYNSLLYRSYSFTDGWGDGELQLYAYNACGLVTSRTVSRQVSLGNWSVESARRFYYDSSGYLARIRFFGTGGALEKVKRFYYSDGDTSAVPTGGCVAASIAEVPTEAVLQVYPNPARTTLYVALPLKEDATAEVINAAGKYVARHTLRVNASLHGIPLNSLPVGTYVLRIVGKSGAALGRAVFVHTQ